MASSISSSDRIISAYWVSFTSMSRFQSQVTHIVLGTEKKTLCGLFYQRKGWTKLDCLGSEVCANCEKTIRYQSIKKNMIGNIYFLFAVPIPRKLTPSRPAIAALARSLLLSFLGGLYQT